MRSISESSRERWSSHLEAMSNRPLAFCPDFPERAARWEAWWRFEADRPLLIATLSKPGEIRRDKAFDLLEDPEAWLKVRFAQLEHTHWIDQAVPSIRVDLGPVVTAAFLGAPLQFATEENTSWQTPIIETWDTYTIPDLDPSNRWFRIVKTLTERTARDAADRYLVSVPDLSGAIDTLMNMRGMETMLFDVMETPEALIRNAGRVVEAWDRSFRTLYDAMVGAGAGATSWLHAWSNTPYTVPTCDFNFMISPDQFREICLPSIEDQARRAGRCVLHLDGPGASIHAPALAGSDAITAVQYTPGAGTPSAVAKLDMLRMLQDAGKPILVMTPKGEVEELCRKLNPRGLAIWADDVGTLEEAEQLQAVVCRGH